MTRILHCADVHLSVKEREYSLSVLNELVEIANAIKASYLVSAGDTFDSFNDLVEMRSDFAGAVARLAKSCEVLLLAGNHEDHGREGREIVSCDLGVPDDNIIDTGAEPFRLITRNDIEFLAIPHRSDYKDYMDWTVPTKNSKFRIAIAHATVADMAFTGQQEGEEEKVGIMDSDLLLRHRADYAALGHLHSGRTKRLSDLILAYPGSARVWRKDEGGARRALIVECDETISTEWKTIEAAGQFRKYTVNLSMDGGPDHDVTNSADEWDANDWIWIDFSGIVEEDRLARRMAAALRDTLGPKARKLDVNIDGVESCAGISTQEIAKRFLRLWEEKKPANIGDELEVWRAARDIGLKKIKEHLEARS